MTVMILKLITGEEVIGDVKPNPESGVLEITNAMTIAARQDENTGQIRMGLIPYAQFGKTKTVAIYPHAIVADYTPADEIYNQYNSLFGGIQLATSFDLPRR